MAREDAVRHAANWFLSGDSCRGRGDSNLAQAAALSSLDLAEENLGALAHSAARQALETEIVSVREVLGA